MGGGHELTAPFDHRPDRYIPGGLGPTGLLERKLLRVMGRKDDPGRPLLYGTSPEFLEVFGLRDLSDLPTLRDLRELRQDDPREGPVQLDFPDF